MLGVKGEPGEAEVADEGHGVGAGGVEPVLGAGVVVGVLQHPRLRVAEVALPPDDDPRLGVHHRGDLGLGVVETQRRHPDVFRRINRVLVVLSLQVFEPQPWVIPCHAKDELSSHTCRLEVYVKDFEDCEVHPNFVSVAIEMRRRNTGKVPGRHSNRGTVPLIAEEENI